MTLSVYEILELDKWATRLQRNFRCHVTSRERQGCILSVASPWLPYWRKVLETAHSCQLGYVEDWLEWIDRKHRYGYILRQFHEYWILHETSQSFFPWLDAGRGRDIQLSRWSRLLLEQMGLTYCTPRMREQYLVKEIVQDNELILVPSMSSPAIGTTEIVMDRSMNDGEWIFVLSGDKELYVNELIPGVFHHSSFLHGAPTLVQGYLEIEHGRVARVMLLPLPKEINLSGKACVCYETCCHVSNYPYSRKLLQEHWSTIGVNVNAIVFEETTRCPILPSISCYKVNSPHPLSPKSIATTIAQPENPSSINFAMALLHVIRIQKRFRAYRTRRERQGLILSASSPFRNQTNKWMESIHQLQETNPSASLSRVKRYLKRLSYGITSADTVRMLHCESWLEAVDPKHRYGHYLRLYHAAWLGSNCNDSFFVWLDHGDGQQLDLPQCSRLELEEMRVVYCDAYSRKHYEVELIPSSGGAIKVRYIGSKLWISTIPEEGQEQGKWIFVLSPSGKLYVNLKQRGAFHHSSFLSGRPVTAAGKIYADAGLLTAFEPHSGHYKPSLDNLKAMESMLRAHGLELSTIQFIKPKKWKEEWPYPIQPPPAPASLES